MRKHNITNDTYYLVLTAQASGCANPGCNYEWAIGDKRMCYDHSHYTDAPRALLCNNCNVILGHAKSEEYPKGDNPDILLGLVEYLRRHA